MKKNGRQFSYCDEIAVAVAIDQEKVARKTIELRVNVELSGKYSRSVRLLGKPIKAVIQAAAAFPNRNVL